ncbi:hypothetical protein [Streptomyces sp. ZSW22]|uniref:hypothetical protein n=1 Tax=Streptomyces sp. ZSW22 TaxID=3055050 RepID=UPI0025AF2343|nr:hypothetical protein [Streptomyces sp. ZSW22]MDN3249731.1 hypothetical protein [Streptomyces sp. ZSW22]
MDAGDWIALSTGAVSVGAAGIAIWQARTASASARHSKQQARAADEQVRVANEQLLQAERLHREQLALAERIHREQNEPYVIVDIQPSDPTSEILVVVIENIGPTMARNVRISCDPPLVSGWGDDLTEMLHRALSRSIPMLPPGRRLEFLLDNQDRFQNSDLPTSYTFTVESEGPGGAVEPLEYVVDFGTWAESLMRNRPTKQIEDKLGKIQAAVKALSDNYKLANSPAIRSERERAAELVQQRRAQAGAEQPPANLPE